MKDYIVGLGEILFDVLPEGKKLGGAPANFAYHATQFGLNGLAVSAIGTDKLGEEVMEQLADKNLAVHLEKTEYPTGRVLVELDDAGVPTYDIKEGVAYDIFLGLLRLRRLPRTLRLSALALWLSVARFPVPPSPSSWRLCLPRKAVCVSLTSTSVKSSIPKR